MRRFLTRAVTPEQWDLSRLNDMSRQRRLLSVPTPDELLTRVLTEAKQSAQSSTTSLNWQPSDAMPGYSRVCAKIPITEEAFDQLFNGRSGYRAQYYLSPEEGVLFNRRILDGIVEAIQFAYRRNPLTVALDAVEQSLNAPHAKIWIYREQDAFEEATPDLLNPARWVENGATRGRRIPLPIDHSIDLKGAFIHEKTGELFVDFLKEDRACDLYRKGYT